MHLLIPYIQTSEKDPDFDEFIYGDVHARGKKLLTKVKKGGYIFFHTTAHHAKYITAYYVVDRVLRVVDAKENPNIVVPLLKAQSKAGTAVLLMSNPFGLSQETQRSFFKVRTRPHGHF